MQVTKVRVSEYLRVDVGLLKVAKRRVGTGVSGAQRCWGLFGGLISPLPCSVPSSLFSRCGSLVVRRVQAGTAYGFDGWMALSDVGRRQETIGEQVTVRPSCRLPGETT